MANRYNLQISSTDRFGPPLSLIPLLFWYDKTHVCSCAYYREYVFNHPSVKKACFIEETLGLFQLEDIKANGMVAHAKHGTWLLDQGIFFFRICAFVCTSRDCFRGRPKSHLSFVRPQVPSSRLFSIYCLYYNCIRRFLTSEQLRARGYQPNKENIENLWKEHF